MFLKYIDFVFQPFRAIKNKIVGVQAVQGNIQVDINRSKAMVGRGKQGVQEANAKIQHHAGGAQPQQAAGMPQQAPAYQQGAQYMQQPGMPGPTPAQGMPPPGTPNPSPQIRTTGFWIFKKKFCTQCQQQLDRTWDTCPYCAQIAAQAAAAPAKLQKLKTQAFVVDATGNPGTMQLLGWLVPLQGASKGELFTLQPVTTIGTTQECTVCLVDKFMSSKHAEIKAENGMWILRDTGSTNGTYVNNRRIDRHELVDNDFIKFGSAMCKFKSL
jgi:hypothetical protein